MRKLCMVGFIFGTMTMAACGGGDKVNYSKTTTITESTTLPNSVITKFHETFPAAHDIIWSVEDGLYKLEFEVGDKHMNMNASFAPDGHIVKINS